MIAEVCWPCVVGLHEECLAPTLTTDDEDILNPWVRCCCHTKPADSEAGVWATEVGRPVSEPSEITDILSTGRKRAQKMYPIYEGMMCEWAYLAAAGGGPKPIIGCPGNLIYSERGKGFRHHGPNKNVIENSPGNVHRICGFCHNRWHALNNEFYGPRPAADQPYLPLEGVETFQHDPQTRATDEDIEANEEWWSKRKIERVLDDD